MARYTGPKERISRRLGVNLFLIMVAVPIKMYLRWIFNLKYIVNIQEFSFNI